MDKEFVEALKQIVSEVLNVDPETVNDSLSPEAAESWDSFNHLVIISALEERLGIVFTSNDVEQIKSFRDLRLIAAHRGHAHG